MSAQQQVEVIVTKTATVPGIDNKPSLQLTASNHSVKVELLPKQGQRRTPVKIDTLIAALMLLKPDEPKQIGRGA